MHAKPPDAVPPASATLPRPISAARQRVFGAVLLVLLLGMVEWVARISLPDNAVIGRRILLGRENANLVRMQNTIGQAYLLYASAPNYANERFGLQHNADGYRGQAVPLDKPPGVLRVLCLGGSTTYGGTVGRPEQAYPAVLEGLLRADLPAAYTNVEVINGGLTWGTTAELLTHYHFKYHYYRPDLIIINTGGNDAEGYTLSYYHPDNSNWRQPMVNLRPLPRAWRWLARSRLASLLMLNVFYADQLYGGQFVIPGGAKPAAPWFKPGGELLATPREIPREHLSFLHNMDALIRAAQADRARVLLVPFRAAPQGYKSKPFELSQILRHETMLRELAEKYRTGYAPFPASVISPENWTDHCHLNVNGEREKAAHIAAYVNPLLPQRPPAGSASL